MSKLQDFISQVKTVGMARSNRFTVSFTPPDKINRRYSNTMVQNVLLFCDQVQVPGVNYSTIQNRTFGEFREVPYEKIYGSIEMSFFMDADMKVKTIFDDWIDLIQNKTTKTFEYYNDYTVNMQIDVEDVSDNSRYTITAYECYPKGISPIQLDYANKDIMKMQVSMMYKYWTSTSKQQQAKAQLPVDPTIQNILANRNLQVFPQVDPAIQNFLRSQVTQRPR